MCGFGDNFIQEARANGEEAFAYETEEVVKSTALIVFVKNPEKGKVKTRLARTVGDDAALKWYLHMLNHTRETTLQVEAHRYLFYSQFVDEQDDWPAEAFDKRVQIAGELGEKMKHAFRKAFAEGHGKVVIVGSDCLDLRKHHLEEAVAALDQKDFVIGPAEDGGYYLLGMRKFQPQVFDGKTWSTESVLPDTLADIKEMNAEVHLLQTLSDVDFEEDLLAALKRAE